MKLIILLCVTVVGTIGGWFGAALSHGNWLSGWSILLGAIGSFVGIWVGIKCAQYLEL